VDRLVEQLGIAGMSKDQVSRLCRGLDEQVRVFCERPLEGRSPYLTLLLGSSHAVVATA
jgi:putative transposase